MTDLPSNDWVLLARYFAGECTAEERTRLDAWSSASPERQTLVATLRIQWEQAATHGAAWEAWSGEQGWQRIAERMAVPATGESLVLPAGQTRRSHVWRWSAAAFVGCAAAVCGILFGMYHTPQALAYTTTAGQRLSVTLDDGTQVTLAPESQLRLSPQYRSDTRQVDLTGEAYFAVVHDDRHPFAVLTHNVKVTDVGTEFDVRAYDARVRVAVAKGEVSLRSQPALPPTPSRGREGEMDLLHAWRAARARPLQRHDTASFGNIVVGEGRGTTTNDTAYLTAGDMAEATDTGFTVTHHADIAALTGWAQGRLVFNDVYLRDAVRELSRAYDLNITVVDSALEGRHVTGAFDNVPADEVLTEVTHVIGAQFERHGRTVVIRQAASRASTPTAPSAASLTTVLAPSTR